MRPLHFPMTEPRACLSSRTTALLIAGFVAAGFALRLAAAQGGLWTDEAWSMLYASQTGPLGVITSINHDNNHHLNSWWLQLVGVHAPVWLQRGLSILSGTASIAMVALIGRRRSRLAGIAAAALFAVSPIMLLYGSEARGYAPMLLALIIAIWRIDLWLATPVGPFPRLFTAVATLIGSLSHLLMIPAVAMLGLWVLIVQTSRSGWRRGFIQSVEAMAPAGLAALSIGAMVIAMALASPDGMRIGGYIPFAWSLYANALRELTSLSSGIGAVAGSALASLALVAATIGLLATLPPRIAEHRARLYGVLIFTLPLLVMLWRPGNSQYARYYLPAALGFILLASDWIGAALDRRGIARLAGAAVLTLLVGGSLLQDRALIANRRGDGAAPVALIAKLAPQGSSVAIDLERTRAIVSVAAEARDYPLRIRQSHCGNEPFRLIERERVMPSLPTLDRCGRTLVRLADADAIGPSGQSWTLYQEEPLQSPKAAVNSPPPTR